MAHRQRGRTVVRQQTGAGVAELVADPDRPRAWTLLVDGIPQSHVDLDDPQYLEFEYVRRIGHLIDLAAPAGQPLRVLHLGGGGLTLARYVAATRPGSSQLVAEADGALVELVRQWLPLGPGGPRGPHGRRPGRVRIRVGDARAVLEQLPAGSCDVVIADLFAGGRTPAHVTSAEFTAAAARALSPAGSYAANIGDTSPLGYARAQVATVRSVFPHACLLADPAVLRGRRFGNLVLTAARRGLPAAELARRAAADPFPGRLLAGDELDRFTAGARPVTDARARPSLAPPPGLFAARPEPRERSSGA
ncbi:MAG: fused MFS/spermidine synthase [Nocardiopsaceae bacterium]|nr:fused MFS/spermidine synthase [Nocardiopsaceae bacterium]